MNLSCWALILFPNLSRIYNELLISGRLRVIILHEKIENKIPPRKANFWFHFLGSFRGLYTASEGNTFISAFCSRWWFKSCHLLFQHLSESKWHNRFSSFRCHKYCKHAIQTEPAVRQKAPVKKWHGRRPRPALFKRAPSFQDRKRAACSSRTGRTEHVFIWGKWFRWYIKHQSRVSFPHTFLVLTLQKDVALSTGLTHTHGSRSKNKQRPFKYQPSCLLPHWKLCCTAILRLAFWNADIDQTEVATAEWKRMVTAGLK